MDMQIIMSRTTKRLDALNRVPGAMFGLSFSDKPDLPECRFEGRPELQTAYDALVTAVVRERMAASANEWSSFLALQASEETISRFHAFRRLISGVLKDFPDRQKIRLRPELYRDRS
jgi:hypothetical protein